MKIRDANKTALERLQKQDKVGKAKRSRANNVSGSVGKPGVDQVSISEKSREIQKLEAVIASTPDIRQEKVEELKEKIEKGEYRVDSREVARRILEEI